MLRNKLVRSDGSIIDSSVILSCEFTEDVNSSTNLTVGDVTASELTVEILATDVIQQDEVLTYYIVEDGLETKIGEFKAEKPTVATRTSMRFSAYDNVIKTEKLFSDWLLANQTLFPMTLHELVEHACAHCGVELSATGFPHADLPVNVFYADDLTCRQILAWAAAISGRFVRANAEGELEFAWYVESSNISIGPSVNAGSYVELRDDGYGNISISSTDLALNDDGAGNVAMAAAGLSVTSTDDGLEMTAAESRIAFLRDSLSYESYTTDLIDRVQINHSEDDVGVIYPADAEGNCFTISQNMILGVSDGTRVAQVAQTLYSQLNSITYVPFNVTVPRTIRVRAGDRITIEDAYGQTFTSYVMKVSVTSGGTTLTATGDKSYESNAAVSSKKYGNLTGKVLEISKSVDGLIVKNQDLAGKVSGLEMSTESFKTYVEQTYVSDENFQKHRSEVEQTTQDITAKFENIDKHNAETNAHIKSGLLYTNDAGVPIYGVEIGQTTQKDGTDVFNKYARFSSEKLGFYDQNGYESAYISDKKMGIPQAEILVSSKIGGFIDMVQEDGSVVTKWIGGV